MNQARSTVSVVGAGHVGAAVANALVLLRECDQVVLHDRDLELAEGEAWDIADTVPLLSQMAVTPAAGYADLGDSDVVVVTAGVTLGPGQTRLDLLSANAGTIAAIMSELDRVCPGAVVILVTNPVNVLTRIAIETSAPAGSSDPGLRDGAGRGPAAAPARRAARRGAGIGARLCHR